jgi:triosephosphate isomerase
MDVSLGAQNVYFEKSGAYTGEISADMLKAIGVEYVIVGHSERREILKETDDLVNKKVKALFEAGLKPILCVGEPLDIRESGKAEEYVLSQVEECLDGIAEKDLEKLTIAYEPIWAIGTGKTATTDDADFMCHRIREKVKKDFSDRSSQIMRIQYGGSVKPHNISELMDMPDIDGALVGGASLNVEDFIAIINY